MGATRPQVGDRRTKCPCSEKPSRSGIITLKRMMLAPPLLHPTTTPRPVISAPVSCRELAAVVLDGENSDTLRVSSALTNSEWKALVELPHLQTVLHVFTAEEQTAVSTTKESQQSAAETADSSSRSMSAKDVHDELEAFLQSTEQNKDDDDDDDDEAYESDGGTPYVKDPRTGHWVHRDLAAGDDRKNRKGESTPIINNTTTAKAKTTKNDDGDDDKPQPRKKKRAKFSSKKARCWVYVTGLPTDCTVDEVAAVFSKAGILDLDESQQPKVKLYRHKGGAAAGTLKGDASVCYARPESVPLAVTLLDDVPFRDEHQPGGSTTAPQTRMKVQSAKFEQRGDTFDASRRVSNAKRKVVKLATQQALDWDDGEFNGRLTGGRKGLRIIVLKHLYSPLPSDDSEEEDRFFAALEADLRIRCEQWGVVEKITVFAHNPQGVAVVKFVQPGAASEAVKELNGVAWSNKSERRIEASFWDGVTDYTMKDEVKEAIEDKKRQAEFGNWLESQEDLPEELRLKTE